MGLEYTGGSRRKLAEAINLQEFLENKSCTFDIKSGDDGELVEGEEELLKEFEENETEAKKNWFEGINLKNMTLQSCSTEDVLGDYDDIQGKWEAIAPGVQKKMFQPGRGGKIPSNAKVWIHYVAYHERDDEPFDNTIQKKTPESFIMGQGKVLPGIEIAVASMELKEVSKFLIQPKLAYGPLGCPPRVPPDSRVLFSIEVLEYQTTPKNVGISEMSPEERAELPFNEIYKAAENLKNEARMDWNSNDYAAAVDKYSRASQMLEQYMRTTEQDEDKKNKMLYVLFNNLAACYLKQDKAKKAKKAAHMAIELPINLKKHKAYYLKGKAFLQLGKMNEARVAIEESQKIESNDQVIRLLDEVIRGQKNELNEEKTLCQQMCKAWNR